MSKIDKIVEELKSADLAYYNQGVSHLSDAEYEDLREYLEELDPHNPYLKSVGAPVPFGTDAKLPCVLGSLRKVRPGTAEEWVDRIDTDYFYITPKLDGLSGELHYYNGQLLSAYTRGNGLVGRIVTSTAKYIQGVLKWIDAYEYPKLETGHLFVTGEYVIHKSIYKELGLAADYKSPRHAMVGLLNTKKLDADTVDLLKHCTFVAYGLFRGVNKKVVHLDSKYLQLLYLSAGGFTTITNPTRYVKRPKDKDEALAFDIARNMYGPPREFFNLAPEYRFHKKDITANLCTELFEKFPKLVDIEQDGLVLEPDEDFSDLGRESDGKTPAWARAIKPETKDQLKLVGVVDHIELAASKRGLVKPVAVLKHALNFKGVDVTRVTVNNCGNVIKRGIGPGAKVSIVRSGDVIPYLEEVLKPTTPELPKKCQYCGSRLKWTETKVDLYCPNIKCDGAVIGKITSFFDTIKIDGVSGTTVEAFFDAGYDTVDKILRMTKKDLLKIEGFADKSSETIASRLAVALKEKPLYKIMTASGCFMSQTLSLADSRLQLILDNCDITKSDNAIRNALAKVSGIGPETVDLFIEALPDWEDFWDTIEDLWTPPPVIIGDWTDEVVAFTGFRDESLVEELERQGGKYKSSLTKACTLLVSNSPGSTKEQKAKSLKIDIISLEDFKEELGV